MPSVLAENSSMGSNRLVIISSSSTEADDLPEKSIPDSWNIAPNFFIRSCVTSGDTKAVPSSFIFAAKNTRESIESEIAIRSLPTWKE